MYIILIRDVYSEGFKVRIVCGSYSVNFVHKRDRFSLPTPDQKICVNTHDQSLNSTDIEIK